MCATARPPVAPCVLEAQRCAPPPASTHTHTHTRPHPRRPSRRRPEPAVRAVLASARSRRFCRSTGTTARVCGCTSRARCRLRAPSRGGSARPHSCARAGLAAIASEAGRRGSVGEGGSRTLAQPGAGSTRPAINVTALRRRVSRLRACTDAVVPIRHTHAAIASRGLSQSQGSSAKLVSSRTGAAWPRCCRVRPCEAYHGEKSCSLRGSVPLAPATIG